MGIVWTRQGGKKVAGGKEVPRKEQEQGKVH
jgi:hypothetical protein